MIERNEMKEILKSGEKVIYHAHNSHTDIEYSIKAIVTVYNSQADDFEIWLCLEDRNGNSVTWAQPKHVRRR